MVPEPIPAPPAKNVIDLTDIKPSAMLIQKISATTAGQDEAGKVRPAPFQRALKQEIQFKNSRDPGSSYFAVQNTTSQIAPKPTGSTDGTKQKSISTLSAANSSSKLVSTSDHRETTTPGSRIATPPRTSTSKNLSTTKSSTEMRLPYIPGVTITALKSSSSSQPESRSSSSSKTKTQTPSQTSGVELTNTKQVSKISESTRASPTRPSATNSSTDITKSAATRASDPSNNSATSLPDPIYSNSESGTRIPGSSDGAIKNPKCAIPTTSQITTRSPNTASKTALVASRHKDGSRGSSSSSADIQNPTSMISTPGANPNTFISTKAPCSSKEAIKKITSSQSIPGPSARRPSRDNASSTQHGTSSPATRDLGSISGDAQNQSTVKSLLDQTRNSSETGARVPFSSNTTDKNTSSRTTTLDSNAASSSQVIAQGTSSPRSQAKLSAPNALSTILPSFYNSPNVVNIYQLGGGLITDHNNSSPSNIVYHPTPESVTLHKDIAGKNNMDYSSGRLKWVGYLNFVLGPESNKVRFFCNVETDKDLNLGGWPTNLDIGLHPLSHFNEITNNPLFSQATAVYIKVTPYSKLYPHIKSSTTAGTKCFFASTETCDDILIGGRYDKSKKAFYGFILNKSSYAKICEVNGIINSARRYLEH